MGLPAIKFEPEDDVGERVAKLEEKFDSVHLSVTKESEEMKRWFLLTAASMLLVVAKAFKWF